MPRSRFSINDGLIGMSPTDRLSLIDELLGPDLSSAEERRELLMDHEVLASQAEFFARYWTLVEDESGLSYVPLKRGKRAYGIDDFSEFLRGEPDLLQRVTVLVRDALRSRPLGADTVAIPVFSDDEWPLALQMRSPAEVSDITAEALRGLTLFERLRLGTDLPFAIGLRAELIAGHRFSNGDSKRMSLHELDSMLCEEDVFTLAEMVRPHLSGIAATTS